MQKGSKKIRSAAPAGNKAHNPKHNPKHDPKQSQKVTHEVRKGGKVAQIVELEDDEDLDLGAQLSLDGPDDEEDDEDDEDFEDDDEDDEDDEELEGDDEDEDEDDEEEDDEANEVWAQVFFMQRCRFRRRKVLNVLPYIFLSSFRTPRMTLRTRKS